MPYSEKAFEIDASGVECPVEMVDGVFDCIVFGDEVDESKEG
jgi:hypothetical protein